MTEIQRFQIEAALQLAVSMHSGQKRFDGSPYFMHLIRVMLKVNTFQEKLAALLHDILEDTQMTLEMLKTHGSPNPFPSDVIQAVDLLTKKAEDHGDENYFKYIGRIKRNPIARAVKIADIYDNSSIFEMPADMIDQKTIKRLRKYAKAMEILKA